MAFTCHVIITLVVFSGLISGLVHPLTKSNGDPDLSSIIFHITMMEGSMKELKTQAQASHDQLIFVNGRLQSTSDELASVKEELKTTQDRLRSAEADIIILQHNKNRRPAVVELSNMKSDIAELKSSMEHNLTIIDLLSRGLKTNTRYIQALKSAVVVNSANIKYTRNNGELYGLQQRKLRAEVVHLNKELDQVRNMTKSMMAEIQTLKTLRSTAGLWVMKSEIADLKSSNAQANINVSIIEVLSKELKTNTGAIQALKSAVIANSANIMNTVNVGELNALQQRNFKEQVANLKTEVNNTKNVTKSIMAEIHTLGLKIENSNTKVQTPYDEFMVVKADVMMTKARLSLAESGIITLRNEQNPRQTAIELAVMRSGIADLKSSQAQQPIIDAMHRDLRSNTRSIQALQSTVDDHSAVIRSTREKAELNGLHHSNLKGEVASLRTIINNARNAPKTKKAEVVFSLDWLGGSNKKDVAFQVTQSDDRKGWTTLKFDRVDFNQGGAYNPTSGYFTAPTSGTYLFWCNILLYHSDGAIFIYKGTTELAKGYTYTADNQVAMTVVAYMRRGEKVHFTADSTDITTDGRESHYGGVLLH